MSETKTADSTMRAFLEKAPVSAKIKIFLAGISALVVFVASTSAIVFILRAQRNLAAEEAEKLHATLPKDPVASEYTHAYEIKDMSMAVMNKSGSRTAYAQFTLLFDCPTESTKNKMAMERAKIIDSIYEAGSTLTIEEFAKPEGFKKFKDSTLELVSRYFASNAPRQVVIKDWFLQ